MQHESGHYFVFEGPVFGGGRGTVVKRKLLLPNGSRVRSPYHLLSLVGCFGSTLLSPDASF